MGEVMRVAIYLQVIILVMKFKVVVTSNTLILKTNMLLKMNNFYYAEPALCTDNGAMIAFAGYQRLKAGQHDGLAVT
jgi:tRNA A37 threonylcarbamoyltransferase TsaD